MRKTFAIILSLALMICMIPTAALAEATALSDADVTITPNTQEYTVEGGAPKAFEPAVAVSSGGSTLTENADYTVSIEAGSGSALTGGKAVNAGTYNVVVAGNGTGYSGTVKKSFTITAKALEDSMAVLESSDLTYSGSNLEPGLQVKDGDLTLIAGTDYTVSYEADKTVYGTSALTSGKPRNPGAYNLVIKGKGNYKGTVKKAFTIGHADIASAAAALATAQSTPLVYSSKPVEPELTVMLGAIALKQGADYTVSYEAASGSVLTDVGGVMKPVNAGTYNAVITGTGYYTGTATAKVSFTIARADFSGASVSYEPVLSDKTLTAAAGTKLNIEDSAAVPDVQAGNTVYKAGIIVKKGAGASEKVLDPELYDISSAEIDSTGSYVIIYVEPKPGLSDANVNKVNRLTVSKKITRNLEGKYKIVGSSAQDAVPAQTYNAGEKLQPAFYVVPISGKTPNGTTGYLTRDVDYTVEYTNNTDAGSAVIKVTGIGNYSGTLTGAFDITPKSVASLAVSVQNTIQGRSPEMTVTDGKKILEKGVDYTIDYNTSTIGTNRGSVTIIGTKNYKGTVTKNFNVIDRNKDLFIYGNTTFVPSEGYYTGLSQAKDFTVKCGFGSTAAVLVQNLDYRIEYRYTDSKGNEKVASEPIEAHDYSVYIVGVNSYGGEKNLGTLKVKKLPFTSSTYDAYLKVEITPNGEKQPQVSISTAFSEQPLTEKTDYTVGAVTINKYTGKGTIPITSIGEGCLEAGVVYITYDIASNDIAYCNAYFTGYKSETGFTGSRVTVPEVIVYDGSTKLIKGTNYTVSYLDPSQSKPVETTSPNFVNCGTYQVIIKGTGFYTGVNTLNFEVTGTDISSYTAAISKTSYIAAGTNIVLPTVQSVKKGTTSALSSSDYKVSYEDESGNVITSAMNKGTYYVVISGNPTRGYTGEIRVPFEIVGQSQTLKVTREGGSNGKYYITTKKLVITGTATGAGNTITYKSSNPEVATIDENGKVTVKALGRTYITVTADGGSTYKTVSKTIAINISPKRGTFTKNLWSTTRRQVSVRWNLQEGTTKYQVRYSRYSDFRTYITKTYSPAEYSELTTQTATLKGLTSGRTYYVKVRSYVEVENQAGDKEKIWGVWSVPKSVVCK